LDPPFRAFTKRKSSFKILVLKRRHKMDITTLFCDIDDFVKDLKNNSDSSLMISYGKSKRGKEPQMHLSELMTIITWYHSSGFKNFKTFYFYLLQNKKSEFPRIISYNRFVEWMPYCLIPLCSFIKTRMGEVTGISYIDSTSISVCKNIRIPRNKVFKGIAARGKSSMGWFFGFKLHIIVNHVGELLAFKVTKGNTHDNVPVLDLCKGLFDKGIHLITNVRGNMKNKLLPLEDKLLLRKRFVIETINDQLKNISNVEHSRHRSPMNFMVNLVAGLISYTYQEKKPSIRLNNGPISLG
jgi:hypothetical protein